MLFLESGTTGTHSTASISARRSNATMTQTMAMNMGMSKSGAETAEELKLSSLKHALHPSVLEEAMPRIAGPERLAETLTSRRHICLSRCRRLALSFG